MSKKRAAATTETNGTYFLKILIYFVFGSIWIKFNGLVIFPIGLIIGLMLTTHDHFKIDRKIEYAVLIVAALLGLSGQIGLYIAIQ
ncbi:hypothetical protein HJC99_03010 [Candidatus Saccharibacteria bacterium]|nr:hypothetical protein [Candidatus Saccharibacteria bacterium]